VITQVKTNLFVKDQDRALDFYVNTLGFEKRRDLPYEQGGFRWIEVSIPGTHTILIFGK
jgi:catechol 2,3-dioxygenase-like lactoylglutathione lyase family enzyme